MISNLEAAVLGLVGWGFRYGYEIDKAIEERRMRNWTEIAFSSIYYVLKKLEKKGLITSGTEGVKGRPSRKVYDITKEGRSVLSDKIRSLLSSHHRLISPFDLGIGYMGFLRPEEALECLRQYSRSLDEQIASNEERFEFIELSDWPFYIKALCTRPMATLRAEKAWLGGFIGEIERHERMKKEFSEVE
jgi:DNA-binding PadR family transcriptional regulator